MLGDLLLIAGAVLLVLAGVAFLVDRYGPGWSLPRPVALAAGGDGVFLTTPTPTETPTPEPTGTPDPTRTPTPTVVPTPTMTLTPTPTPVPAGDPIRVVIPRIGVDSEVKEAGTYTRDGQLYYATLPFVVAHYGFTAKAGAKGNSVYSGHVTSLSAGNVFANLYQVKLGDEVRIFTANHEFIYVVTGIREVVPTDVSVTAPTPDATATLITCSGQWIPSKDEFDRRLIVTAKLKS